MKYKLNINVWNSGFAVPSSIIDNYVKLCGGVSLKALLLMLRHSDRGISVEEIAELLSLSVGDTNDALNYWVTEGVLAPDLGEATEMKPLEILKPAVALPIQEPIKPIEKVIPPVTKAVEIPIPHDSEQKLVKITSNKPVLSRDELHRIISQNRRLENLIHETQQIMGKTLTSAEMDTIVSLYSYYGLACDFILMAIQYCCSINKINMRYIEKTIAAWVDLGVDNLDKAENHIAKLMDAHSNENQIRSAFGISDRTLITKEQQYINVWFNDFHFDIAMIKLAFERTVEKTGKLSFAYTNTILTSWYNKGIKTTKDASMDKAPSQQTKPAEANPTPKHAPSRSTSYDINELEKMIYSDYSGKKD